MQKKYKRIITIMSTLALLISLSLPSLASKNDSDTPSAENPTNNNNFTGTISSTDGTRVDPTGVSITSGSYVSRNGSLYGYWSDGYGYLVTVHYFNPTRKVVELYTARVDLDQASTQGQTTVKANWGSIAASIFATYSENNAEASGFWMSPDAKQYFTAIQANLMPIYGDFRFDGIVNNRKYVNGTSDEVATSYGFMSKWDYFTPSTVYYNTSSGTLGGVNHGNASQMSGQAVQSTDFQSSNNSSMSADYNTIRGKILSGLTGNAKKLLESRIDGNVDTYMSVAPAKLTDGTMIYPMQFNYMTGIFNAAAKSQFSPQTMQNIQQKFNNRVLFTPSPEDLYVVSGSRNSKGSGNTTMPSNLVQSWITRSTDNIKMSIPYQVGFSHLSRPSLETTVTFHANTPTGVVVGSQKIVLRQDDQDRLSDVLTTELTLPLDTTAVYAVVNEAGKDTQLIQKANTSGKTGITVLSFPAEGYGTDGKPNAYTGKGTYNAANPATFLQDNGIKFELQASGLPDDDDVGDGDNEDGGGTASQTSKTPDLRLTMPTEITGVEGETITLHTWVSWQAVTGTVVTYVEVAGQKTKLTIARPYGETQVDVTIPAKAGKVSGWVNRDNKATTPPETDMTNNTDKTTVTILDIANDSDSHLVLSPKEKTGGVLTQTKPKGFPAETNCNFYTTLSYHPQWMSTSARDTLTKQKTTLNQLFNAGHVDKSRYSFQNWNYIMNKKVWDDLFEQMNSQREYALDMAYEHTSGQHSFQRTVHTSCWGIDANGNTLHPEGHDELRTFWHDDPVPEIKKAKITVDMKGKAVTEWQYVIADGTDAKIIYKNYNRTYTGAFANLKANMTAAAVFSDGQATTLIPAYSSMRKKNGLLYNSVGLMTVTVEVTEFTDSIVHDCGTTINFPRPATIKKTVGILVQDAKIYPSNIDLVAR